MDTVEALAPITDFYVAGARDHGALRVGAGFRPGSASGPNVMWAEDDTDDLEFDDMFSVMDAVPPQTVAEWALDATGRGTLAWFTNPNFDVVGGRIGAVKVGRRSSAPAPIVALTDRVADNDLAEIESLLRARGHDTGFSERQVAAAEKKRKVAFPPELRLFFSLVKSGVVLEAGEAHAEARGDLAAGTGAVDNVVDARKRWGRKDALPVMPAATPHDVVQPAYASPNWIVFADDGGGNAYAIDLAPGPNGAIGQVVQFDHERDEPPGLAAASLTAFLRGEVVIPEPWGEAAGAGTKVQHSERAPWEPLSAANGLTATSLYVSTHPDPLDLGLVRGSRALVELEFDEHADHPAYDLSALTTLTALQDLAAPETVWKQVVEQDAWPPALAAASITEARSMTLPDAVDVANAVLAHYGREGFTVEQVPIGG